VKRYDVIVIGSGLGGLECALVLSKEGMNVCVVEKNRQIGGLFQSFVRKGKTIDSSIHYVGSLDKGEILHRYFSYFGIMEALKVERLNENGYDHIHIGDEHYSLAMGHENFVESLSARFPKEHDSIKMYSDAIRKVGELSSVDVLKTGIFSGNGMDYFTQSAIAEIENITSDAKLREVLWGTSLLYAGVKEETPFYLHAITNNSNLQGAYRFRGGSHQVASALAQEIKKNGGTIITDSEVTRIVIERDSLKGVVISNEEMIESKYVISNLHPSSTLKLLDENIYIRNSYTKRITQSKSSYGLFCLYLIMKPDSFRYINENHYIKGISPGDDYALVSMQSPEKDSAYAEVVTIVTPMYYSEVERWSATTVEKRGEEYRDFKNNRAHALLNYVSACFPGLKESVEYMYTATPLTFRDYTSNPEGSAYGMQKNYKTPYSSLISPKSKVPNLLLTGQNLNVHGVVGVTITSMLTCSEIIKGDYLAKKIGNLL
jgi:phytoene dehydrogenase-like protein